MQHLELGAFNNIPNLPTVKRKAVAISKEGLVKTGYLPSGEPIPLVIEPTMDQFNLIEWAESKRELIETQLLQHRAILFRNFNIKTVPEFERFVSVTSSGDLLEYRDRTTPRTAKGNRVYTSTVYPADQRLSLHNEGGYWIKWGLKIYFCCMKASEQGGETPIADVRNVYQRIAPEIRDQFAKKKMMLVRNYNDGFGLSWQEAYQTSNKADVERYCRDNLIEFEWKDGDRLRTRQIRSAVRQHPKTGELVWFNHAAFFHYTSLEPAVREVLLFKFGEDELPYNTYYGDGTPIEPEVIEHIRQAYEQEKISFPWQEGDVLLLDNMSIAHGREPFLGERLILVAMTEPVTDPTIATLNPQ